ncbi:MAG TPA: hypothetical protein VGG11_22930 [Xanthobacteraceae bacterium]
MFFRVYCIDERGHICSVHECEARDDAEAIEVARRFCGAHEVEIWDRARRIARLGKDGEERRLAG